MQKTVGFLYTNDQPPEKEIRAPVSFTVASKKKKKNQKNPSNKPNQGRK
jgi:hypothetical protein